MSILVAIGAYLMVLIQIGILNNWPLLGGAPNLIALFAIIFLVIDRLNWGIIWILTGCVLIDLITPGTRFGLTLIPLSLGFAICVLFSRHFFNAPLLGAMVIMGVLLAGITELSAILLTRALNWKMFFKDLVVASILILPIASIVTQRIAPTKLGLKIKN